VTPTTDILTHGPDRPRRLSRRGLAAVIVVGLVVVGGLVAWRSRPAPAPEFRLVDLQGVYAGMVRSDGQNDAAVIDPRRVVAEPETVEPAACEPLFEASVLNRPPPGALDGVGTFWALGASGVSLFSYRFAGVAAAGREFARLAGVLDGCRDARVAVTGRLAVAGELIGLRRDRVQLAYVLESGDGTSFFRTRAASPWAGRQRTRRLGGGRPGTTVSARNLKPIGELPMQATRQRLVFRGRDAIGGVLQPRLQVFCGHRPGESVALQEVAANFPQDAGLFHGLDALGDHLDAERTTDVDDGRDEALLALAGRNQLDELPIDFEPARHQAQETDERGVTGAEIIDVDADPHLLDRIDVPGDAIVELVEKYGFEKLEGDRARFDVEFTQRGHEVVVAEPPERNVDRDGLDW